ncbi:glycosyltransferase family 4 protein [Kiloniella laminariae]|uniref:Glycosyltransferase family 4 protein n=1 Tax=Kiloniella laminariae TaxID=454162 RepID=A0ABT4LII4_9PROT|nr:glycosyltransferase family 4 protein [Kiloniella laminariae]MCZ4280892.1 glycosyltransferase family 4 protein [Kiloniella laminariae]
MKICQICAVDFSLYHMLLPLMKGMREAGHDVVGVCSEGPLVEKIRAEGFQVETVEIERSMNLLSHAKSFQQLTALFKNEKFDLVHAHTPVASLIARFAAKAARVPNIAYTAHGFYFHDNMPPLKRNLFLSLEWLAGRQTNALMTQAQEDAETAKRYNLCPKGTITAIGNGVDTTRFYPATPKSYRKALRTEFGAQEDETVILMVGRLVREKGYVELVQAMRKVDATLWIVGSRLDSDHASDINEAISLAETDPKLKKRIRFLGYRTDVNQIMRACDIFTLPSHREGMPRSIIEAMMTGLPVVATDIRGSREEVLDGTTGILVPVQSPDKLADALCRLVNSPKLRENMGNAGRERALELYDEQKVIARQLEILQLG